jgi:hypothetical protein
VLCCAGALRPVVGKGTQCRHTAHAVQRGLTIGCQLLTNSSVLSSRQCDEQSSCCVLAGAAFWSMSPARVQPNSRGWISSSANLRIGAICNRVDVGVQLFCCESMPCHLQCVLAWSTRFIQWSFLCCCIVMLRHAADSWCCSGRFWRSS